MGIFTRGKNCIHYCLETVVSKIRWSGLTVDGLFRKRFDTQITVCEGGKMKIGNHVEFYRNVSLTSAGGNLDIGNNVFFNRNCIVICHEEIQIKEHVIFGPGVTIYDHDHKFNEDGIQPGFNCGPIIIEKGCWIGANVTILRNTHIGEGCVIGAGAIVKGDIPAHSLVTSGRELNIVPIRQKEHNGINEHGRVLE